VKALRNWLDRRFVARTRKAMTLANPGRELAKIGADKRRASRRQKVEAHVEAMCADMGIPVPAALRVDEDAEMDAIFSGMDALAATARFRRDDEVAA
jgi:hypothetical protein